MAKGQKKSNKETRKPKAEKPKVAAVLFLMNSLLFCLLMVLEVYFSFLILMFL